MRSYFSMLPVMGMMALGFSGCSKSDKAVATNDVAHTETAQRLEYGQELVADNCAACHAVGREGDSPRADAPPLRIVLSRYNSEALLIDFVEHIHVGPSDMPDFDFGPKGSDAVVAYLQSIQVSE